MKPTRSPLLVLGLALAACDAQSFDPGMPPAPPGTTNPTPPATPPSTMMGGGPSVTEPNPPGPGLALPCDVDRVLAAKCRSCHAAPPRYGAPMPLLTYADTQAPAKSDPSRKVYQLIAERIANETRPMPPTADLTPAERTALDGWLSKAAPAGASCTPGQDPGMQPPPAPLPGPDSLPCTPTHEFRAHAENSQDPFHVPLEPSNLYQCFTFRSPFSATEHGTAWAPIIDDVRVIHHWILYRTHTAQPDGGSGPCQMPSDATFVSGWAPGGGNYVMPPDVDLEMPGPNDSLILQVHYHNLARYTDAYDASGVALCTSETPRANTAGFYTLGSVRIDIPPGARGQDVTGECPSWATRFLSQSVTVLASFPHMHQHGTALRTDVYRGGPNGRVDRLVDVTHFDFENQTMYPNDPPFRVDPGDTIRTTCTYSNDTSAPLRFGERTEDEMCFNFVMLYPISLFPDNRSCGLF